MKIHEFQAKQILSRHGVSVPRGKTAETVEEAVEAAMELGSEVCVVKAQIHAGGRGKGGGVKVCRGLDEVRDNAQKNIVSAAQGNYTMKKPHLSIGGA